MDKITLENFRCFRERQTARLAPLTLLVGENSTGKTSFLAVIRALWDVVQDTFPNFKKTPYDLGSFDEIAYYRGGRGGRADTFEAGFEFIRDSEEYCFDVTFKKRGAVPSPVRMRCAQKDTWIECKLSANQSSWEIRCRTENGTWGVSPPARFALSAHTDHADLFSLLIELEIVVEQGEARWTGQAGSGQPSEMDLERIRHLLYPFTSFYAYGNEPYASAPVRSKPRRTYDPARPTRDPEGDYVPMYLSDLYFQDRRKWETLKGALEKFGQDAGLFDEILIRAFGKKATEPFQVQIRKFSNNKLKGPSRNLIDVGYGVSQVLPVITELLRQDAPTMFLLQQPEVHLHPSAQAALGSLFCQVARPDRQLVVETHSDHLLDRVRMDVRDGEGNLKPEDVSILFFEPHDLSVCIHSLKLDEEGNVLNAPPSYRRFFMEEVERSIWKRRTSTGG